MNIIHVISLIGSPCLLAPEKGATLAETIRKSLQSHQTITVDFSGYEFLSSAFLNHAFGQLCIQLGWDINSFHQKLTILGLDGDDMNDVELALDNAQTRRSLLGQGINPEEYYSSRLPV
ncbi:MAG: STAS-like domain-containing protein [Ignavibacteriae bacterium]|nr:STAS-like domain-containing protein [Ignavibacteriota bacterium]